MILFEEVYNKAIVLFDDPKITSAFQLDKIVFCKLMYGYLQTVSIFEPIIIGQKLTANFQEPSGQLEIIDADGVNQTFTLTIQIPEHSILKFTESGDPVDAVYDASNNSVTFPDILPDGMEYGVEYYFPGAYNVDFTSMFHDEIGADVNFRVKNILARMLVIAWAENTRNMLVDIQGLLRDSDFKATPNNQILNAKINWITQLGKQNNADQNKLSWYLRYSSNRTRYTR